MTRPKLIMLSGFAASGKTTIGRLYLKDHPLTLFVEGDEIIVNLGQWLSHEPEASRITQQLVKSMIITHLDRGHDVLWPFLLSDAGHIAKVEALARKNNCDVYEFYLDAPREIGVQRLLERGVWGEADTPPITVEDLPRINEMYDKMLAELPHRPNAIKIDVAHQTPLKTYHQIITHLGTTNSLTA